MSAHANPVFAGMGTTIFSVMSALAVEHRAINLGQGFPDEDGPPAIREAAAKALIDGPNQYPPTRGLPQLRQAIAAHAKRFYELDFDADREVLVTSGGTEALTACIMAFSSPGSEVVIDRAGLRFLQADGGGRRRHREIGQACPAQLAADGRGARGRRDAQDVRDPDQLAAQSHRPRVRRAGTRCAGARGAEIECGRHQR